VLSRHLTHACTIRELEIMNAKNHVEMDHLEMYNVLHDFFGLAAIQIENITRTMRERKSNI
jgi:hypothetical protein